ncbi:MAG: pantetheine-phosphate adenylyltransferase [Bacillales bacterium]|nr:pantetheine-phosphate adenylyltransferase [Bacillales bacterium]
MKIGLYPGSFDPLTKGHIGVIEKGSHLFDKLYVCILENAVKKPMFSKEDRLKMAEKALKKYPNVSVVAEDGLTINACHKYNAGFILRGLRSSSDFEFEFEVNNTNLYLDKSIETVLVMTNIDESHISSSIVRELIGYKCDYSKLVPEEIYNYIEHLKGSE